MQTSADMSCDPSVATESLSLVIAIYAKSKETFSFPSAFFLVTWSFAGFFPNAFAISVELLCVRGE